MVKVFHATSHGSPDAWRLTVEAVATPDGGYKAVVHLESPHAGDWFDWGKFTYGHGTIPAFPTKEAAIDNYVEFVQSTGATLTEQSASV